MTGRRRYPPNAELSRRSPASSAQPVMVQPGVEVEQDGQMYRRKTRPVQEERRQGSNDTTEVEKASKHSNKKEEKIKLKIRQSCSHGNVKEKKKDWKERTELRKEHMWQCAFSHVAVPSQYFGFL